MDCVFCRIPGQQILLENDNFFAIRDIHPVSRGHCLIVAKRHCQGRIISCLEGGYVLNPLARSVAEHVKVLIGAD